MEAFDQDDLQNAILCVWKEARGDGYEVMDAVAHVIFNRVGAPGFPNSLHDVIYRKNQFSSMSISTDPNTTFRHQPLPILNTLLTSMLRTS
jgi:hypothetical protein